jgi:hypothetical protein
VRLEFSQNAASLLQAAVILEAATSAKQQSSPLSHIAAPAQTERCGTAESRRRRDDRILGERSSRRDPSWRCLWRQSTRPDPAQGGDSGLLPSPGAATSRRRAGAAALQGIASAQLVGVGIVALDESQQRGAGRRCPVCTYVEPVERRRRHRRPQLSRPPQFQARADCPFPCNRAARSA